MCPTLAASWFNIYRYFQMLLPVCRLWVSHLIWSWDICDWSAQHGSFVCPFCVISNVGIPMAHRCTKKTTFLTQNLDSFFFPGLDSMPTLPASTPEPTPVVFPGEPRCLRNMAWCDIVSRISRVHMVFCTHQKHQVMSGAVGVRRGWKLMLSLNNHGHFNKHLFSAFFWCVSGEKCSSRYGMTVPCLSEYISVHWTRFPRKGSLPNQACPQKVPSTVSPDLWCLLVPFFQPSYFQLSSGPVTNKIKTNSLMKTNDTQHQVGMAWNPVPSSSGKAWLCSWLRD